MKAKFNLTKSLLTLLLVFGSILSCKDQTDEASFNGIEEKTNLSVKEAREHFEAHFSGANHKDGEHDHSAKGKVRNKKARWENAYHKTIAVGESVVVPMSFDGLYWKKGDSSVVDFDALNYTMMYKDKKGEIQTEWVTLHPDQRWLDSDRSRYTGNILVRGWDGEYKKMYTYKENGNVQAYDIVSDKNKEQFARTNVTAFTYRECYKVRDAAKCTCIDKLHCDWCDICAPEYCYEVTIVEDGPEVPTGGTGGTGGTGPNPNPGSGGGSGSSGGAYVPQCNSSIPPGTTVAANQLPACPIYTPVVTITNNSEFSYFSLEKSGALDNNSEAWWWSNASLVDYPAQPTQSLPTWAQMYANYPKDAQGNETVGSAVFNLVGGEVLANKPAVDPGQEPNACALRVSRALNYSGVTIPANLWVKNDKGVLEKHTFKGADNKWYFLGAAKLHRWMTIVFPIKNHPGSINVDVKGAKKFNYDAVLGDKKGIYIMIPSSPATFGASGHASIWWDGHAMYGSDGFEHSYLPAVGGTWSVTIWGLQ